MRSIQREGRRINAHEERRNKGDEKGEEREKGSALRGEFLRELIFAAAAAGDGFVRGEKEAPSAKEIEQITNATSRTNGEDPSSSD